MAFVQYSPQDVILTVNLKPVAWESITIEFAEDKRTPHMGIDGTGRHIKNLKNNGTITITLMDYSPSNGDFALVDKLDIPVIITCVDKSSKATAFATDSGMLSKVPALNRSAEGGTNEWVFNFISGELIHSGAKD
jgi:hypothetical protein